MVSSKYDQVKYLYVTDLGRLKYKWQRAYYVEENGIKRYTTPITSLFLARIRNTAAKTVGSSAVTRRLLTYAKKHDQVIKRTVNLPYAPGDPYLSLHIKEILDVEYVLCGDYFGESPVEDTENV